MTLQIYGAGGSGKDAYNLLLYEYNIKYGVIVFLDRFKKTDPFENDITSLQEANRTAKTIIAIKDPNEAEAIFRDLKKRGFSDLWWFSSIRAVRNDFFEDQCVNCSGWGKGILKQVEMHVMDRCNLNCRGCTHFSPIFNNGEPDVQLRLADVRKLAEKYDYISSFFILGGEPFLNQNLDDYINGIREILPYTNLTIVTNGLLIPKDDNDILNSIRLNNVTVSVSGYAPTMRMIDVIKDVLDREQITYHIRKHIEKAGFNIPLALSNDSNLPRKCMSDGCVTIWNGMIARCPSVMYINEFNRYFNTNLPAEGVYNIDDCPEGDELNKELEKSIPLCNHCVENYTVWASIIGRPELSDFAVER